MSDSQRQLLYGEEEVELLLATMARDVVGQVPAAGDLAIIGIHRRGVELAERLAGEIRRLEGSAVPTGSLDITLYRDDLMAIGPRPVVGATRLPAGGIDGRPVVIVDDVLYTGRTVRAALDELADFGRPKRILLAVLVDRSGRELPIHGDVVGARVDAGPADRVEVLVPEVDGRLAVELVRGASA